MFRVRTILYTNTAYLSICIYLYKKASNSHNLDFYIKCDIIIFTKKYMDNFKKNNRFGDKRGGGFNKGAFRPSFGGGKSFGGGRPPLEMFSATCASCGKTCEVPFKPNGKKPVYCKECFAANGGPEPREGGNDRGGDRNERFAPRRDFDRPRSSFKPEFRSDAGGGIGELKRTMEAMNSKLDKLVSLMSAQAPLGRSLSTGEAAKSTPVSEVLVVEKKSATKKVSKKKK